MWQIRLQHTLSLLPSPKTWLERGGEREIEMKWDEVTHRGKTGSGVSSIEYVLQNPVQNSLMTYVILEISSKETTTSNDKQSGQKESVQGMQKDI